MDSDRMEGKGEVFIRTKFREQHESEYTPLTTRDD